MVKPVSVVAPPAISCSWIFTGNPGCELVPFVAVTTTFEATVDPTVTVTAPVEAAKAVLPAYVAVMVLTPAARALPFTVTLPVAVVPEATSVADPSERLPDVKVMLPEGATPPLAAFTVAVNWVVAVGAMLAAPAAIAVVVTTAGAVNATVTEPVDAAKPMTPL
jgi:hypothetical protein